MKNAVLLLVVLLCGSGPAFGQAGKNPQAKNRRPRLESRRRLSRRPRASVKPAPPPPEDIHFKSRYTTGDQITESVTFIRGTRERYELGDMVLIRQHDLKQTVHISVAARTYLIAPEAAAAPADPAAPAADMPKPPGVREHRNVDCRCRRTASRCSGNRRAT
jgi:hypothetical protein